MVVNDQNDNVISIWNEEFINSLKEFHALNYLKSFRMCNFEIHTVTIAHCTLQFFVCTPEISSKSAILSILGSD